MDNSRVPHFSYLGDEIILSQFSLLAENLQKALGDNSNEGISSMTKQIENIKTSREKWPGKILKTFKERTIPVFAVEDVTKLNQSHCSRIEYVNDDRKRNKETLRGDIARKKKMIDEVQSKRDKMLDIFESQISSARNEQTLFQPYTVEFRRLSGQISAVTNSYNSSMLRLQQSELLLQQELAAIERQFLPIRLLSTQSNQKNLIVPKQNSYLGWIPHLDLYQMLICTKVPPESDIFRHISYEPESKLSNLPLSVYNLIHFADKIGADDRNLLTMLTIYLKKYKPHILDTLDTKKGNISAVIESLAFHCTTSNEKQAVLSRLRNFQRSKDESFAHSISKFDSLHTFYLQLDSPAEAENIRMVSYNTLRSVVPYLISPRCNQALSQWILDSQRLGSVINKEAIIRTVTSLESFSDLQLTSSRHLPAHMVSTTLNLPPTSDTEVLLQAHSAVEQPNSKPLGPYSAKSPLRSPSASNDKKQPYPRSQSGRIPSRSPQRDRPGSRPPGSRPQSKSPNRRDTSRQRGRSSDTKTSIAPQTRSSSSNFVAELDTLQYYSIMSKSPNVKRKTSMPTIFRRPLTPNTYNHLKSNYFYNTSGGNKFADVKKSGNCLRCYSKTHRASACPIYTSPTPHPCRNCHFLFHPTDKCRYYDSQGKSRPVSVNKTA